MLATQTISIYLNNALRPTHIAVELDGETPLPESVREMPDRVAGRFIDLDDAMARDIEAAWKRVMVLNATEVLYSFTFEAAANRFSGWKR